ncbi:cellulose binding domain-containing protein [Dactylosporangium aurantiacum]|uniref:Cellulose binding domain-containing protein n=1 Tax=Dactylosporangium aurantiacum TaxID=35754 RepID=A0A9Q9M9X8_9ACTN|nr:cellulose binding domain-containing protein [Dactylosporangium aurantiacum]MDG6107266.1 cellulose binding domain-containing protein [Dactylosporangium aurantiacum]UWZ51203.1 cellulose binding domain-containing protein [Dactylosporangium aurantiacum]
MRKRLAVLGAAGACAALLVVYLQQPSAQATVPAPATPVTGNATYFDGLGSPYGGCGLPQAELETQDFVALNVFDTPGDGSYFTRPVPPADAAKMGVWDNGRNCGRWVQVKIADYCTGTNDGALGQPFCRNGAWTADAYNGGVLNMLVADSCADTNAWCRDDPYHLDLSKASLNRFAKNGTTLGDLYPNHWNNRHVDWNFIPAPGYSGDIQIGFLAGAQRWWPAIAVSHLPNGIHGVEYYADGAWHAAQPNRDMGQSFIIGGTTSGATQFRIRATDAADAPLFGGREYSFALPSTCSTQCGPAYTKATYTTTGGSASPSSPSSPSASVSVSPSRSVSPSASRSPSRSPSSSGSTGGCSATVVVTGTWDGGYQAEVTVRNTGATASAGWSTSLTFPGTQRIASSWNAVTTQTGAEVTATNQPYNAVIPPAATTSWGMVVSGQNQPVTAVSCTLR